MASVSGVFWISADGFILVWQWVVSCFVYVLCHCTVLVLLWIRVVSTINHKVNTNNAIIGTKVNEEELSLYIRRKDVLNVVKELELKSLEGMVVTMRKRLLKHFRSDYDLVSELGGSLLVC